MGGVNKNVKCKSFFIENVESCKVKNKCSTN